MNDATIKFKREVNILVEIISANNLSLRSTKTCNGVGSKIKDTNDMKKRQEYEDNPKYNDNWIERSAKSILVTERERNTNSSTQIKIENKAKTTSNNDKLNTFCKVLYKNKMLHQTLSKPDDKDPIWSIDTGSLFLFNTSLDDILKNRKKENENNEDIVFEIRSKIPSSLINLPRLSPSFDTDHSIVIGSVSISPYTILKQHCTEERFEFDLLNRDQIGTLALRFRIATKKDIEFVQYIKMKESNQIKNPMESNFIPKTNLKLLNEIENLSRIKKVEFITEMDEAQVAGTEMLDKVSIAAHTLQESMFSLSHQMSQRFVALSSEQKEDISYERKVTVKPHADPKNPSNTRFMTSNQIDAETFESPSHHWVEAGSGNIGRLYLEILGCHDLPNMDVGEAIGNKTDAFVSIVYEDVFAQTPVIQDELSPRWLPWTQRAFKFNMIHPSSMLHLAVFDFDLGLLNQHEGIGRVSVNLANLKKDVEYTLRYDLYPSSSMTERKKNGSLTIRLRIEIDDERAFLLAGLKSPPKIHVNVKKEKSFHVVRYTCFGEYGEEDSFDLTIFRSYINEILQYKRNISYSISDATISLLFWRGQVRLGLWHIPLHSILFYISGMILFERSDLLPAMFFFSIAWIFLACMGERIHHPSPWKKCNTFLYFWNILLFGQSSSYPKTILSNENKEQISIYENAIHNRVEKDFEAAAKRAEIEHKINNEIGNENIQTVINGMFEIEMLNRFGRWQKIVGRICHFLRRLRIILLWEESHYSFWISLICIGFGILCLILPTTQMIYYSSKFIFYTCFGPWMKIVDIIFTANANNEKRNLEKKVAIITKRSHAARAKREEAVKLQRLKMMKYGDYIISVPILNSSRHYDYPLTLSTAIPTISAHDINIKECGLIPGQQLYGVMIPRPHQENESIKKESIALRNNLLSVLDDNNNDDDDIKKECSINSDENVEETNLFMNETSTTHTMKNTNIDQDISNNTQCNSSSYETIDIDSETEGFEVALMETISIYQMEKHHEERIIPIQLQSKNTFEKVENDITFLPSCNSNESEESRNDKSTDMLILDTKSWETKSNVPESDCNSVSTEINYISSVQSQEGLRKRIPLTQDLKYNFSDE